MGLTMSQQQAVTKTIGRRYRWTLLHRYGNLARFLRHLPNPPKRTFDVLAERRFGTKGANAASL
jgi:hypothetical protein